ncbi:MAG: recombination mediator RecR [Pseudomonadota bacterium]
MSAALPPSVRDLILHLSRLPGVGHKTATRLAFHLVNHRQELAPRLAESLTAMAARVTLCESCFNICEAPRCPICEDPARADVSALCVVEGVTELQAVEGSGRFHGRYHVLHGLLSPMKGVGPQQLRLDRLPVRCREEGLSEVVVATSLTSDGETTALYIKRLLSTNGVAVTRLASGVPFGGTIEFLDSVTLGKALEDRRPI